MTAVSSIQAGVAGLGAAAPPMRSRLEATGLQKSYGPRKVVKDVHLAVSGGEVVGPAGPQRCGQDHQLLHDRRAAAG